MKYKRCLLATLIGGAYITAGASPIPTAFILMGNPGQQISWTVQNSTANANLSGLAQNGPDVVAVGETFGPKTNNQGISIKSSDQGTTWTQAGIIPNTVNNLDAVTVYGTSPGESTTWLAVGNGNSGAAIVLSADGIHWESDVNNLPSEMQAPNAYLHGITNNNNLIIAVGNNKQGIPALILSKDGGHSWQSCTSNLPTSLRAPGTIQSVQWDTARKEWVASGFYQLSELDSKGFIITSQDGSTWTLANLPADNVLDVKNIAIDGQTWVAATDNKLFLLRSIDGGANWTQDDQHLLPENIDQLNQINWNGATWLLAGIYDSPDYLDVQQPLIFTSKGSLNWNTENLPGTIMTHFSDARPIPTVNASIWNGNKWLAVGMYQRTGSGCYSLEGIQWHGPLAHLNVSSFNLFNVAPTSTANTYNIDASIDYTDYDASFGYGVFSGQCIVNSNGSISVRNLTFNSNLGKLMINADRKNDSDPSLSIGPTCLPDEKDGNCNNFQGSLSN